MNISLKKIFNYATTFGIIYVASTALAQHVKAADNEGQGAKPDAQMQAVLDELAKLGPKPLGSVPAVEARKQPTPADAVTALLKKQGKSTEPEAVGKVENKMIAGPGGQIPIRIYYPKGQGKGEQGKGEAALPVILYIHGGGWVIADLDTYDASPRALVNATNAIVVSSHYRQAPEHKFPAAHDDIHAAYEWVLAQAKELNGDPKKIALVGESAGGNMAAALSVMAREHKMQMPIYQVLIYPVADNNLNTPSYNENANAKPLNRAGMQWFFKNYFKTPADGDNHLISLVDEKDLKGLPPTTIITAEIDPLRSEGKAYADLLEKAGVNVRYKNFEGVTHEFFGMAAVIDKAKEAQKFAAEGLKEAFTAKK